MASIMLCRIVWRPTSLGQQILARGISTSAPARIYDRKPRGKIRGQPIEGTLTHPRATSVLAKKAKFMNKFFALDASPKEKESKEKVLNPNPVISKGGPLWLDIQSQKGAHQALSNRRQALLNRSFTEAVSDVLQHQALSDKLLDMGVQITTVKVTANCMYLHIYWSCNNPLDMNTIGTELSQLRPEIRKHLAERNFTEKLPHIYFIYDKQKIIMDEFKLAMREVIKDRTAEENRKDPNELETPDENWYKDLLDQEFTPERRPLVLDNEEKGHKEQKGFIGYPADMDHNALGLDFKNIMQQVLGGMKKARSSQKFFTPNTEDLPPVEYRAPIVTGPPTGSPFVTEPSDPDDRVRLMRRFIVEERKKRQRLVREARKIQALADLEYERKRDQAGDIVYGNTEEGSKYRLTEDQKRILEEDLADRQASLSTTGSSGGSSSTESDSLLKIDFMYGRKQQ